MSQNVTILPAYAAPIETPSILSSSGGQLAIQYTGDLEVVEVAEELNDAAKLKESSTFDTDVPYNSLSRWLVGNYGKKIPILANAWGLQLPDTQMLVNGYSESSGLYDVSFVRDQEWPEFLKNLSLIDLDGFEPFQMSEAFIDSNHAGDVSYTGTNRGFYTPLAYYGGLNRFNQANSLFEVTYADFRLWFHYGKILEEAFSAAGWSLDCPVLKTAWGKRMIGYFTEAKVYDGYGASPAFINNQYFKNKLQLSCSKDYAFYVGKTTAQVITGTQNPAWQDSERVTFDDDSTAPFYDKGDGVGFAGEGFYNTAGGVIQGYNGKWSYHIKLRITGGASPILAQFGIVISDISGPVNYTETVFYNEGGEVLGSDSLTITVPGGTVTTEFNFYVKVESVLAFRFISPAFLFGDGVGLTIEPGSTIEGHGEFVFVTTNSILNQSLNDNENNTIFFPQSWLSSSLKAIEVLESYCHRTNSKIYTDRARRIVGIYTESEVPTYGEETEPYYFNDIQQDLTGMQILDSATVDLKEAAAPAKYVIGFKESTDAYIETVQKTTPFDAVVNLDTIASPIDPFKETENRDNITEPTLERDFVEIRSTNPNRVPISAMAVLDNMVGECSTKIAPRTAIAYGTISQRVVDSIQKKTYFRRWGGVTAQRSLFAYATQLPSGVIEDAVGTTVLNDKTIVYDNSTAVSEPLRRYWIERITRQYRAEGRKLTLLIGSFNQFVGLNFRNLFGLTFMGVPWTGRLKLKRTKVNDFRKVEVEMEEEI